MHSLIMDALGLERESPTCIVISGSGAVTDG